MTRGQKFIKENFVNELTYDKALEESIKEFRLMGIVDCKTFYGSNDNYLDCPVYPCNAELYDEFCDEYGFMEVEFASYCVRKMENEKLEMKN